MKIDSDSITKIQEKLQELYCNPLPERLNEHTKLFDSPYHATRYVPSESTFRMLAIQYLQTHRVYHGISHIYHLIELARHHNVLSEYMAYLIMWHDAFYIPGVPFRQNEENSARLMLTMLESSNSRVGGRYSSKDNKVPDDMINMLVDGILATADHTNPDNDHLDTETKIFLDLDLYDLGVEVTFNANNILIMKEFEPFFTKRQYLEGRIAWMESMVSTTRPIYRVFKHLEQPARENMIREVTTLKATLEELNTREQETTNE